MKICFDTETEMIGGIYGLAPPLITCGMVVIGEKDKEVEGFYQYFLSSFPPINDSQILREILCISQWIHRNKDDLV